MIWKFELQNEVGPEISIYLKTGENSNFTVGYNYKADYNQFINKE